MDETFFHLPEDRAVVAVAGPDAERYIGDLVSGPVAGLGPGEAAYAGLLSPQGKVLFDFIVLGDEVDGARAFLLDLPDDAVNALVKRLTLYKLRAKVEIVPLADAHVVVAWGPHAGDIPGLVPDPRLTGLGMRGVLRAGEEVDPALAAPADAAAWHAHRIALGVPEAGADFAYGEPFPHDIAMDDLLGVDFKKGCFVGQEVVSRMQHRGTARRRVVLVTADGPLPEAGATLAAGGKPAGTLGSAFTDTDGRGHGIAIARLDRLAEALAAGTPIDIDGTPVEVRLPAWAHYGWPEGAADA